MFSNATFKNGEDFYHRLNLIFNLLIALPLVPFGIMYLATLRNALPEILSDVWLISLVNITITGLAAYCCWIGFAGFKSSRLQVPVAKPLRAKMIWLHKALMRMYLMFEAASILVALGLYLTQSKIHVISYVVILVIMSLKRPTLKLVVEVLQLNEPEANILREKLPIA
ncbi:MAG: hypothetical protein RJQ09_00390 [Cyclobacteriaceae bacterium]